jgi:hypothetical protein
VAVVAGVAAGIVRQFASRENILPFEVLGDTRNFMMMMNFGPDDEADKDDHGDAKLVSR